MRNKQPFCKCVDRTVRLLNRSTALPTILDLDHQRLEFADEQKHPHKPQITSTNTHPLLLWSALQGPASTRLALRRSPSPFRPISAVLSLSPLCRSSSTFTARNCTQQSVAAVVGPRRSEKLQQLIYWNSHHTSTTPTQPGIVDGWD